MLQGFLTHTFLSLLIVWGWLRGFTLTQQVGYGLVGGVLPCSSLTPPIPSLPCPYISAVSQEQPPSPQNPTSGAYLAGPAKSRQLQVTVGEGNCTPRLRWMLFTAGGFWGPQLLGAAGEIPPSGRREARGVA